MPHIQNRAHTSCSLRVTLGIWGCGITLELGASSKMRTWIAEMMRRVNVLGQSTAGERHMIPCSANASVADAVQQSVGGQLAIPNLTFHFD